MDYRWLEERGEMQSKVYNHTRLRRSYGASHPRVSRTTRGGVDANEW